MAPSMISIVDADPDLAEQLDDAQLERARHEALTRVQHLSPGEWDVAGALEPDVHHRGFLIVVGPAVPRGRRARPPLHRADRAVRRDAPVVAGTRPARTSSAEVGWKVLEDTRLAVLDHALVTRINPWPQLGVELFNRGTRRAHHLAVALAIAHHQRVEDRLLLTLWHLAERWGKVTPDGIVVPLPLGHQRLARHRRRPPPVGHDRDGRAGQGRAASAAATTATGSCTATRPRSCASHRLAAALT